MLWIFLSNAYHTYAGGEACKIWRGDVCASHSFVTIEILPEMRGERWVMQQESQSESKRECCIYMACWTTSDTRQGNRAKKRNKQSVFERVTLNHSKSLAILFLRCWFLLLKNTVTCGLQVFPQHKAMSGPDHKNISALFALHGSLQKMITVVTINFLQIKILAHTLFYPGMDNGTCPASEIWRGSLFKMFSLLVGLIIKKQSSPSYHNYTNQPLISN